jgi:HAE1 family hydrophobic/amphiphilic exporter-1/multidrug efflux pump
VLGHGAIAAVVIVAMACATWLLERATPTALAPNEDQGYVLAIAALPPAASMQRTKAALEQLDKAAFAHPAFDDNISVTGFDVLTNGERSNAGVSFVLLKDWSERPRCPRTRSPALFGAGGDGDGRSSRWRRRGGRHVEHRRLRRLRAVATTTMRARASHAALVPTPRAPEVTGVGTSYSAQVPRVNVAIDVEKAKLLGVSLEDVNVTLQSTFGAFYVNDFNRAGRVYRVQMQSDAKFREHPEDLREVSVRSKDGAMVPLTAIAAVREITGPDLIERFNLFPSARLFGGPGQGFSSGQGLATMEELAAKVLPEGYTLAWSGESFQEKTSGQSTLGIFALAVLMVFLILAAQYERLTLPFAVILAVPFAVFGAFLAVWLRGLYIDL